MLLWLMIYFLHQTYQILMKNPNNEKTNKTNNSVTQLPNRNFSMTFTFYKYTFRNKEIVRNLLFVNNRYI